MGKSSAKQLLVQHIKKIKLCYQGFVNLILANSKIVREGTGHRHDIVEWVCISADDGKV